MEKRLKQLPKLAEEAKKENKKYFVNLRKRTPKDLDYVKIGDVVLQQLPQVKQSVLANSLSCKSCIT